MPRDENGLKYRPYENAPRYWDAHQMNVTADQMKIIWKKPSAQYKKRWKKVRADLNNAHRIFFLKNGETWVEVYSWAGPFGSPYSFELPKIAADRAKKLRDVLATL